ncbi:hypothetical protein ABK040_011438 [Willaertia magna]
MPSYSLHSGRSEVEKRQQRDIEELRRQEDEIRRQNEERQRQSDTNLRLEDNNQQTRGTTNISYNNPQTGGVRTLRNSRKCFR